MLSAGAILTGAVVAAQAPPAFHDPIGVTPASLVAPLADSWPTYSGDYTGRRYSALTQVNRTSVKHLSLAWVSRLAMGRTGRPGAPPINVGGHGPEEGGVAAAANVRGSVLQVNGVLYVTDRKSVV